PAHRARATRASGWAAEHAPAASARAATCARRRRRGGREDRDGRRPRGQDGSARAASAGRRPLGATRAEAAAEGMVAMSDEHDGDDVREPELIVLPGGAGKIVPGELDHLAENPRLIVRRPPL